MGGLLLFCLAVKVDLSAINSSKEVQQRLNGPDARVLAAAVDELPDEAQSNPGVIRNGLKSRSPGLAKTALQVICNGFNGVSHGS